MKKQISIFIAVIMLILSGVNAIAQDVSQSLAFGVDKNQNDAILSETVLEPGVEYKFPVSLIFDGKEHDITDDILKDIRFSYNKISNTAVKTFKIDDYKGKYYLFVELKASVPNEVTQVKYNIKVTNRETKLSVFSQEVKFQFGYSEHSDEIINDLYKGDEIEISNSQPVLSKSQLERIAKINDYKKVKLVGPSWSMEVNITDEDTKNLLSDNSGIKEIIALFPEHEFKFFNFPGKPQFTSAGKVALDVEDIVEDFNKMYAYRYANGRIYALKTVLNEDNNMLEFRTNILDNFFLTNYELKDGYQVK